MITRPCNHESRCAVNRTDVVNRVENLAILAATWGIVIAGALILL